MIHLLRVHRDAKGTTRWLEPVAERIRAMSARFDGNPDALVDDVYKRFAAKDPTLGLFVGVDSYDTLVGHALAFVRDWDGRWVAWVSQVEHDGAFTRTLIDQVLVTLTDWVDQFNYSFKNNGIVVDRLMFCTPHMHDAWARHSGFTDYRMLKQRLIPHGVK